MDENTMMERQPLLGGGGSISQQRNEDGLRFFGQRRRRHRVAAMAAIGALALTCAGAYATTRTTTSGPVVAGAEGNEVLMSSSDDEWEAFKEKYGKSYESYEHEEMSRKNFEDRRTRLDRMNRVNGEEVFGITRHADRPAGSFAYHRGRRPRSSKDVLVTRKTTLPERNATTTTTTIADSVDWRADARGVVTPVKNQGQCGSCWAFSATEQIESQMVLAGSPAVELSPQQLASCAFDPETCCDGCGGGDPSAAYEYLMMTSREGGLAPEAYWPYTQSLVPDGECEMPECTSACDRDVSRLKQSYEFIGPYAVISGYGFATSECVEGDCSNQNIQELAATLNDSPISVCVNAQTWDDYTGGVLTAEACGNFGVDDIDHCVQLVGYNKPENYWILRNSWSTDWGEDGYIRLQFDANTCGLANEATVVQIQGQWTQP